MNIVSSKFMLVGMFLKTLLFIVGLVISFPAMAEKVVFASYEDIPPKIYRDKGELKGTYVEIIREACKRMKVQPEFVTFPWARAVVMARTGKVDALFPPFVTEERKEFLYFHEPVSETRNMVFALKKRKFKIRSLEDLKGLTVGVNDQYSYGPEFDAYKKNLRLDLSGTQEMLIQKLGRSEGVKRVDVVVASEEAFRFMSKKLGYRDIFESVYLVSENPSYVAFSKARGPGSKELAERFGKTIQQMKNEGVIQKIFDDYMK
nr:transporter substrate-binding domain-containing protein [Bdellovibrio sp. CKG001]